jgi:hypothetical protein
MPEDELDLLGWIPLLLLAVVGVIITVQVLPV